MTTAAIILGCWTVAGGVVALVIAAGIKLGDRAIVKVPDLEVPDVIPAWVLAEVDL